MACCRHYKGGFTLIEVLVGTFLVLIVFLGIFGGYQLSLKVIGQSKNKVIAAEIAQGELEKVKNLPYESVGTVGGFPDGVLDVSKTTIINGVNFTVETRVDYVVDTTDGISSPEDDCPNDYKKVEVKVSWSGNLSGEIKLVTDISPKSLAEECAETGGILSVSVFDAYGIMVPMPLIEIKDPVTDQTIKDATPIEGKHFFSLPPATYKIVVSKTGYSTDRSYGTEEIVTPSKPNPIVLDGQLTEISFSIDKLSSFSVDTLSTWGMDYFSDSFQNQNKISDILDLAVSNGEVVLATEDSQYKNSGYLVSVEINPTDLVNWEEFSFNDSEPLGTQILYQVLYFDGANWLLIPDIDLMGNSIGFITSPIDLSGLDINDYPQLKVKANFSTIDNSATPVLYDWQVSWKSSQAFPITNVPFNLEGAKIIGTDAGGQPVYKYSQDLVSGNDGHIDIPDLEWDSYTFSLSPTAGLNLISIDPSPQPIGLVPDTSLDVSLYLEAQNSLLVLLQDVDTGEPIFSANVRLYSLSLGYDETRYTNEEGKTYFVPLASDVYTIEVTAQDYSNYSGLVSVSGSKTKIISLLRIE